MAEVRERFGETPRSPVQHVVSHAHIDHFGWVGRFTQESDAAVYVHELDARVLVNFEERIVLASKDLRVFMERAGVKPALRAEIEEAYRWSKNFFKSVEISHLVRDRDRIINGYRVHHTPGHCPGQICLEVDDLLFTADHVLSRITPHQSPAAITPFWRLELYLQSRTRCAASRAFASRFRSRSAHRGLDGRIAGRGPSPAAAQPGARHLPRAAALVEVSKRLFGLQTGYTRLLALGRPARTRISLPARGAAHRELGGRDAGEQARDPLRGPPGRVSPASA